MARVWRTRKYYRVSLECPITLRVNRVHKKQVRLVHKDIKGKLLDISEGGCGIEADLYIPKLTRVNLFLHRQHLVQKDLSGVELTGVSRIVGFVVGCAVREAKKHRIGMKFLKISSKDRKLIATLIKTQNRRQSSRGESI